MEVLILPVVTESVPTQPEKLDESAPSHHEYLNDIPLGLLPPPKINDYRDSTLCICAATQSHRSSFLSCKWAIPGRKVVGGGGLKGEGVTTGGRVPSLPACLTHQRD